MTESSKQKAIRRIAFLQDYRNRPWTLKEVLPEVARKGYHAAAFSVRIGQEAYIKEMAETARELNLEVMAFTSFMKYEEAYLKDHPDQRMILSDEQDAQDQDHLKLNWGCPFHPDFLDRYLTFLKTLGKIPNLTEAWVNDEAYLGSSAKSLGCYCPTCQSEWTRTFGGSMPEPPFTDRTARNRLISWRFERWNAIHEQMKRALNVDHAVRAIFLTSPTCCLDLNPWVAGVDLATLARRIDGIMTDPYYTYHLSWGTESFFPHEIYLSEHCRYVRGAVGPDRRAEICVQGFSHPTFTRPLDERDGRWSGIIPEALGCDGITAYTYLLQKISPVQKTYEDTFRLDRYFENARPLDHVAVIDSLETQCFHIDVDRGKNGWRQSRLLPAVELLRHRGLSYTYLPSTRLTEELGRFPVAVLPGVSCLSTAVRSRLRQFVHAGGLLVALGETGTRDETGELLDDRFMEEVFGVRWIGGLDGPAEFAACEAVPAIAELPWPDDVTAGVSNGTSRPVLGLDHMVEVSAGSQTKVLAAFSRGSPAITHKPFGQGHGLFVAGIPTRNYYRREYRLNVLNLAPRVLGRLIEDSATHRPCIRVLDFPPRVPMSEVRPLDLRWAPTAEVFPCVGEDYYLVTVASYFREPMRFGLEIDPPTGKRCREVRELVRDLTIPATPVEVNTVRIEVEMGFDDDLKVFGFFF